LRNAPSIYILNKLLDRGATIAAVDPRASRDSLGEIFKSDNFHLESNQYNILKNTDCLLLLTEWREFRSPDFNKMKSLMKTNIIFDGRNLYNKHELGSLGFELHQV